MVRKKRTKRKKKMAESKDNTSMGIDSGDLLDGTGCWMG